MNLNRWVLEIADLGEDDYITLASGDDTGVGKVLTQFDPQTLSNGFYQLRLSATDIGGRTLDGPLSHFSLCWIIAKVEPHLSMSLHNLWDGHPVIDNWRIPLGGRLICSVPEAPSRSYPVLHPSHVSRQTT